MTTANQKPKHKPSEKHTLEEVLKSLQDLIRNDIIDGDESPPTAAATPSTAKKDNPPPAAMEQHAADTGAADETDIDAVLDSLKDLIVHELESPAAEQESPSDQLEEITLETPDITPQIEGEKPPPDMDAESPTPPSPPATDTDTTTDTTDKDASDAQTGQAEPRKPPTPPGGAQETFAFDEEPLPTIEVEETSLADMPDIGFPALETSAAPETTEPTSDRADTSSADTIELTPENEEEPPTAADTPADKEAGIGLTDTPETRRQKLEAADPDDEKNAPLVSQDAATRIEEPPVADMPATDIPADMDLEEAAEISFDALPEDLSSIPSIEFENVLEKAEETPPELDDRKPEEPPSAPPPEGAPPETIPVTADTVETPEQTDAKTSAQDVPPAASADYPSPAGLEVDTAPEGAPAAEAPLSSDDIPVLDEVAAKPPEASVPAASETALPTPDHAREIAIKIIAKLNIELRKCGERGLSPATIDRLQYLLREALEHGTGNKNR